MEKAPELQEETPTVVPIKISPTPPITANSELIPPSSLIGVADSLLITTKRDIIRNGAQKLVESFFPQTSPFSSLLSETVPINRLHLEDIQSKISSRKFLLLCVAVGAGVMAFRFSYSFLALLTVLWIFVTLSWWILEAESAYIQTCLSLPDEFSLLDTEIEQFLSKIRGALQLVQEVELVSRGYRITAQLSPITRLEENAKGRRCQLLRRETFSSLTHVATLLRSILIHPEIIKMPSQEELTAISSNSDGGEARISVLKNLTYFCQNWSSNLCRRNLTL